MKCLGVKTQDKEKMRWIITKTNNGRNVQFTKFSVIDFFLADRRNLLTAKESFFTAEFGLLQILQFLSATRNASTKATEFAIFGFSFCILISFIF